MKKLGLTKKNLILFGILLATAIAIIVVDQLTKVAAANADESGRLPISVVKGVLSITYIENFGGAFGSLAGSHVLFFILTVLALPMFGFLIFYRRNDGNSSCFGIALMLAGTIGNAIDRAFRGDGFFNGGVRDFIATECFGRLDSVFNVADISLVVGVALFAAALLFFDRDSLLANHRKKLRVAKDEVGDGVEKSEGESTDN